MGTVERKIAEFLAQIPEVESVYVSRSGDLLEVFTIVGDVPEDTYDRIYEREGSVICNFNQLHFDFNVISRRGRSEGEIVGSMVPVWRRSESGVLCLDPTNT